MSFVVLGIEFRTKFGLTNLNIFFVLVVINQFTLKQKKIFNV